MKKKREDKDVEHLRDGETITIVYDGKETDIQFKDNKLVILEEGENDE